LRSYRAPFRPHPAAPRYHRRHECRQYPRHSPRHGTASRWPSRAASRSVRPRERKARIDRRVGRLRRHRPNRTGPRSAAEVAPDRHGTAFDRHRALGPRPRARADHPRPSRQSSAAVSAETEFPRGVAARRGSRMDPERPALPCAVHEDAASFKYGQEKMKRTVNISVNKNRIYSQMPHIRSTRLSPGHRISGRCRAGAVS
jgi:hypothetical protein